MGRTIAVLLGAVLACGCQVPLASRQANSAQGVSERLARIHRVEHGLLRGARIAGEGGDLLADRMRSLKVPGLSLVVVENFEVSWAKGYGLSDVGLQTPVTERTLFQAASISKPVTAMAALKKVEEHKLSLDASINDALVDWRLPENDFTRQQQVTLRLLLSHQACVTEHGFIGYRSEETLPTLRQILEGAPPANSLPIRVDCAPATRFRYSSGGYMVVEQALIDTEKRPFSAILNDTVLGPLGMSHSTFEVSLTDAQRAATAAGYDAMGRVIEGRTYRYPESAAAGLWSTPTDLAHFAIELALASKGKSSRVLSQPMARAMLTKATHIDGTDIDVGLGVDLHRRGNATYFEHDGITIGFQSRLVMNPETGYGAVVMVNSDRGLALIDEVIAAIAVEYDWEGYPAPVRLAAVDPKRLAALAGTYQVHADRLWRVEAREGSLLVTSPLEEPTEFIPISDKLFVSRTTPARYSFNGDDIAPFPSAGSPAMKRVALDATTPLDDVAAGRVEAAIQRYQKAMASASPTEPLYGEERFVGIGIEQFLMKGNPAAAVLALRVGVALHPYAMRGYDMLAEAYARAGERGLAIATHRASLDAIDRDPDRSSEVKAALRLNVLEKLRKLGATRESSTGKTRTP